MRALPFAAALLLAACGSPDQDKLPDDLSQAEGVERPDPVVENEPEPAPEPEAAPESEPAPEPEPAGRARAGAAPATPQGKAEPAAPPGGASAKVAASPVVRRMAKEQGIDLASVAGSGPGGRITREDLEQAAAGGGPERPAAATRDDDGRVRLPILN